MYRRAGIPIVCFLIAVCAAIAQADDAPDTTRDILVTFDNTGARQSSAGLSAPYRHRKRYAIASSVRRHAAAVADEYSLVKVEHWPIRALNVYCFVFRVAADADRNEIITRLNADVRVESAQALQRFETSLNSSEKYDDTYAKLQYGLDLLDIAAAHEATTGAGVRIAIVDSLADKNHEDLVGRIGRIRRYLNKRVSADEHHGTAIASVIGAHSNNAIGIVGIAPDAEIDLYVSCWSGGDGKAAICDTFSILKALDELLENPPHVLNLSLTGPHDALLERIIQKLLDADVVIVAAGDVDAARDPFPSSMDGVIGVVPSSPTAGSNGSNAPLFAPGNRIMVAVPADQYDFRSGSSLAAAHVSGVVALLLAAAPDSSPESIRAALLHSQSDSRQPADQPGGNQDSPVSVNVCKALELLDSVRRCGT